MKITHKIDDFLIQLFSQYKQPNNYLDLLQMGLANSYITKRYQSSLIINAIAFDIAFQGTQGFSPSKDDYRISARPGKLFSIFKILSCYNVNWSLAMPVMVGKLRLNDTNEYELATQINNNH